MSSAGQSPERVSQLTLDSLGTPLYGVTFVVVDLETNGLPSHDAGITEIGAVKVQGGEVVAEFQTLVNPRTEIPPFITLLTGITNEMVVDAPELAVALPAFFEWAGDAVLVAHNAGFDLGFLRAGAQLLGREWHHPQVLDTLTLARAVLLSDEVANRKLSTLASHFGSPVAPIHRALEDARATAHVMHGLFERLGSIGTSTLEELLAIGTQINASRRKKRTLADHLPEAPGVYIFRDDRGRPLYVGKSNNVRKRAMSYFTRSETRDRMGRMLDLATEITAIECATDLEAGVRELRLILEHKPAFNRAGMYAEKAMWLRLTDERFPRLSAVRQVRPDLGLLHFGPVRNANQASLVIDAVTSVIGLRTCTQKLKADRPSPSCALAELGRCTAPCELRVSETEYAELVAQFTRAVNGADFIERELRERIARLAAAERFEEAALNRDRLAAWLQATCNTHRLAPIAANPEIVAAAQTDAGWEVHVIRHGFLAASGNCAAAEDVVGLGAQLQLTAQAITPAAEPAPAGTLAEARLLLSWLGRSETRLIESANEWSSRWPSQLSAAAELDLLQDSKQTAAELELRRRPARFTAPR